jgi:hypothetical protein
MLRDRLARGAEMLGDFARRHFLLMHELEDRDPPRLGERFQYFMNGSDFRHVRGRLMVFEDRQFYSIPRPASPRLVQIGVKNRAAASQNAT